ncbi:response regulator [Syntrophothermus sp.]|uniref:response regulator n=1 Tax=Syntrophothermus sp. TaxID=2736299 RepID=UPI00257EF25D|nr:response regulator [Syntrophothermus sp.]
MDDDPIWREKARSMFYGHPRIRVAYLAATGREAIRWAEDSAPDAAVVDHGLVDMSGLEAAEKIAKASPGTQVFIVTDSGSMDLWRKATAIGVQQVFTKPYTDADIGPAIEEAVDRYRKLLTQQSSRLPLFEKGSGPKAKYQEIKTVREIQAVKKTVAMVISPKGGVGKTTMAVNIACAVAAQADLSVRAAIIDLNEFGTVSVHLNLGSPEKEIGGRNILAFQHTADMDADELSEFLVRHRSGLWVLPSVPTPESIAYVNEDLVRKVIEIFRRNFDFVVLDLPPSINLEVSWAAADHADCILVVVTPDIQVVRGMVQINETLTNLKVSDKCYRIVNMHGMAGGMELREMDEFMPYPTLGVVKENGRVREAVKRGTPLVLWEPDGEFAVSIREIANKIFPVFAGQGCKPERKNFLGRIFKKILR